MDKAVCSELKFGVRIDSLLEQDAIRPPNMIKIDTDGIEIQIVRGMEKLLRGTRKPKSILVEIQKGELTTQKEFMANCGYTLVDIHLLGKWKDKFDQGTPLEELAFNAIFEPRDGAE